MNTLREYLSNVRRFSPEARLYLLTSMLQGTAHGVFQLFFNFYILSLGYRRDFLGVLISVPALTALGMALLAGYLSDLIGRKRTFLLGGFLSAVAQLGMLLVPTPTGLIAASVLRGVGMSLFSVTAAPFLMEHSSEAERTHLFSFSSGISTMSAFLGNFVGGYLPTLVALQLGVEPTSSPAYAWSLGLTSIVSLLALLPLVWLRLDKPLVHQDPRAPLRVLWQNRESMGRLLVPSLVLSLGAGMLMPFMNVFFRFRYGMTDEAIGSLFGFGSLAMGVAILIAPILAERWGKARTVVITQGVAIFFLVLLGFVPHVGVAMVAYFFRLALMNLSGPVYQTMVMEEAEAESRGMAASLYSMIWNLGRAVSPSVSGPLQELYGFDPVFMTTILSYALSVFLVHRWFVRGREAHPQVALQTEASPSAHS